MFDILREASRGVGKPDGMEALFIGRRMNASDNQLVAITVWRHVESLQATMSQDYNEPRFLPALEPFLENESVEHFETVIERFEDLESIGR